MRILKLVLQSLLLFTLSLVAFLIGLATLLWIKPDILLNEKRIKQALQYTPNELKVSWQTFFLDFRAEGLTGKGIRLSLDGLCVNYAGTVDTCFDEIDLDLGFTIAGFRPALTRLERVNIQMRYLNLPAGEESKEEPALSPLPDLRFPPLGEYISSNLDFSLLGELDFYLKHMKLENKEGDPLLAALRISKLSSGKTEANFRVDGGTRQRNGPHLDLGGELLVRNSQPAIRFEGEFEGGASSWSAKTPLLLTLGDSLQLNASPTFRSGKLALKSALRLQWNRKEIALSISRLTSSKIWEHAKISLQECNLDSLLNSADGHPAENYLRCKYRIQPSKRLFPELTGNFVASLGLEPLSEKNIAAKFKFEEKSSGDLLSSDITLRAETKFDTLAGAVIEPKINLAANLKIPEFQAWKEFWEKTSMAVPAPLHVLNGPVSLGLVAEAIDAEEAVVSIIMNSDLHSSSQAVVLGSSSEIRINQPFSPKRAVVIDSKLELTDLRLEAPPLALSSPPQFLPDSRFVANSSGRSELPRDSSQTATPVRWRLKIQSIKPVRIATNILPSPVPIGVNLVLTDSSPMQGQINVLPMPLKIFKKKAQVERVNITYAQGSKVGELDGLLTHQTPEVLIRVLLLGNTENLRVDFQSDPPLTEQQILAVFLYNKSLAELSEEEANSAQNLSQALSDGAMGLFSLFFLSSTPIQSIGYDPTTQNYSARVGLDDKTTLSVGSDFADVREFGLRRRLGGRWALRTELRQETNEPDVVMTLLEWFRRF